MPHCNWCDELGDLLPASYLRIGAHECRDWNGCCDRLAAVLDLLERVDFMAVQLGRIRVAA